MNLLLILVSLLKAIPALESLVRLAVSERDRQNEAEALRRKQAKDAAVDEAIDHPPAS